MSHYIVVLINHLNLLTCSLAIILAIAPAGISDNLYSFFFIFPSFKLIFLGLLDAAALTFNSFPSRTLSPLLSSSVALNMVELALNTNVCSVFVVTSDSYPSLPLTSTLSLNNRAFRYSKTSTRTLI